MDRREDAGEVYPGGGFAPASGGARPDAIAELAAEVEELAGEVEDRPTRAEIDAGWWSEWTVMRNGVDVTSQVAQPVWDDVDDVWNVSESIVSGDVEPSGLSGGENTPTLSWTAEYQGPDDMETAHYTATRHRVAAPVPTKTSDLTNDSGFLTQHQQLTPVYEGGVEWTYAGLPEGAVVTMPPHYVQGQGYPWEMLFTVGGTEYGGINLTDDGTLNPVVFNCSAMHGSGPDVEVTATRQPIIGYTLGSQTDKPLQPQGDYAPATNIAKTALAPNVQTSLGKADTAVQPAALAGAVRYDLPANATAISSASTDTSVTPNITYGEVTLADRTDNRVVITAAIDELRIIFPAKVPGKVRDFALRIYVAAPAGSAIGNIAFAEPRATGEEALALESADGSVPQINGASAGATATTLLYFTETSAGTFLVKGEQLAAIVFNGCLAEGTPIMLADGSVKNVEDVGYDDELLVWNHEAGRFSSARPSWIMQPYEADGWYLCTFESGRELCTCGAHGEPGHRLFDIDAGRYNYERDCIGHRVRVVRATGSPGSPVKFEDKVDRLISVEWVDHPCMAYNVITEGGYNLYADGVLTSCRLSNGGMSDAEVAAYWDRLEKTRRA